MATSFQTDSSREEGGLGRRSKIFTLQGIFWVSIMALKSPAGPPPTITASFTSCGILVFVLRVVVTLFSCVIVEACLRIVFVLPWKGFWMEGNLDIAA